VNGGMGIPPKIMTNSTTAIIPNMMSGIKKRNAARTTMAMAATTKRANIGPSKAIMAMYCAYPDYE